MSNENEGILSEIEEVMNSLNRNDKIVINSLSFLAEDYKENFDVYPKIVTMIENKLKTVPTKLPFLYLIDSIMKNVGEPYISEFGHNLVSCFTKSFEETLDPQHRKKLYDLRKTWIDVFPNEKLFALDRRVNAIDPAWPVASPAADEGRVIHVNPRFLKTNSLEEQPSAAAVVPAAPSTSMKANSSSSSSPASSSSSEERRPPPESRPVTRPLQLPLPPFYHDVPRPGDSSAPPPSKRMEQKAPTLPKVSSSSSLRDPRLQKTDVPTVEIMEIDSPTKPAPTEGAPKKRKIGDTSESGPEPERDMYLIDRAGDNSIEKKAKSSKKNKKKKMASAMKSAREDQDMRSKLPSTSTPTLPPEEAASDVDMRLGRPPVPHASSQRPGPPGPFAPDSGPPPFGRFNRPIMPNAPHHGPRPRMPLAPRMNGPAPPFPGPRPLRSAPPAPKRPPGPPPSARANGAAAASSQRLKIDKPRWRVLVPGFDELPEIGVDPRLLNPCRNSLDQTVQEVTINGCSYTLLLDRLQPLINVNGLNHAVRFRVDHLDVLFKRQNHTIPIRIPGNDFARISFNMKQYTLCVGGPHHELIIDGAAYPVSFNGYPTSITLKDTVVSVKIVTPRPRGLDVLPAIPPHILKWASESFFGPASLLHLPPLNPIERMEAAAAAARAEPSLPSQEPTPLTQPNPTTNVVATSSLPPTPVNVDVFQLFERLVKVGLVKNEPKPKLDIDSFKASDFLQPNLVAKDYLYEGYQCLQCGLRYLNPESEEFTAHMDYHFLSNNSRERSDRKSRSYFESCDVWLTGTCGPANHDESDSDNEGVNRGNEDSVPATVEAHSDDALNICSVCFEKFEVTFSDEAEAWVLVNAIEKGGLFYHPTCVEDAWKGVAVDMAVDPHLALQKVLEGKMEAVFKPDLEDGESGQSSDDGVKVVVQSESSNNKEEQLADDTEVPAPKSASPDEPLEVEREAAEQSTEPTVDVSPVTPLQDEVVEEPHTPLNDESPFIASPEAVKKEVGKSPSTPVLDETDEVPVASRESSCPGTPVRDEIIEPGTPVKDEPLWA